MKLITTSWDDGHPMDFKMAELLSKYNLAATFYIPKNNVERQVMTESQVAELGKYFEVGGHTINHVSLNIQDEKIIDAEVRGSFNWLKDLLKVDPVSFSVPGGVYSKAAVAAVFESGYKLARTTEMLTTKYSLGDRMVGTTLQVYEHGSLTYIKHLVKRGKWVNLVKWLTINSFGSLAKMSAKYLNEVIEKEGCFHLWGHSWEIDDNNLWKRLEEIFKVISNRPEIKYIQNKDLPGR